MPFGYPSCACTGPAAQARGLAGVRGEPDIHPVVHIVYAARAGGDCGQLRREQPLPEFGVGERQEGKRGYDPERQQQAGRPAPAAACSTICWLRSGLCTKQSRENSAAKQTRTGSGGAVTGGHLHHGPTVTAQSVQLPHIQGSVLCWGIKGTSLWKLFWPS